ALTIGATAFAQTPANATRQRKTTPDNPTPASAEVKPSSDAATTSNASADATKRSGEISGGVKPPGDAATAAPDNKPGGKSKDKKPLAEVTADGQTNRA